MRMSISTTSGRSARDEGEGGGAVVGLAHDLDVVLGVEQHPEAGPHERLVVGQHDPDHDRPSHVARTRKPPPCWGPASRRPPVDSARSRMPRSPSPLPFDGPTVAGAVVGHLDRQATVGRDPHGDARVRGARRGGRRW